MEELRQYDVAIAGGGIAGCTTAIALARAVPDARILLLERGRYPRQKVCGEFVSPESLELLACLLPKDSHLLRRSFWLDEATVHVDGRSFTAKLPQPAASISRLDLDHELWRAAEALHIDARQTTSVQETSCGGPFVIQTLEGAFWARAVVDASGRWSNLRAVRASRQAKYVGLKAYFNVEAAAPSVDLYFFTGGYCGVQPVTPTTLNVCAMARADIASRLEEVFPLHPKLKELSRKWRQVTESVTTSPLNPAPPSPVRGNILCVGDAAGFIDPFMGDGIALALHSGVMAAAALTKFLRHPANLQAAADHYAADYRRELRPAFRRAATLRRMLQAPRPLRSAIMQLLQLPAIANNLVQRTRLSA